VRWALLRTGSLQSNARHSSVAVHGLEWGGGQACLDISGSPFGAQSRRNCYLIFETFSDSPGCRFDTNQIQGGT